MTTSEFIAHCQYIVTQYDAGKYTLYESARQISPDILHDSFVGPAHPMVYAIARLAADIAERYRGEEEDADNWLYLTELLSNYRTGKWSNTYWILKGAYTKGRHGYGVTIRRQNGNTDVVTAAEPIREDILSMIKKVNTAQTDEWYLRNVAMLMPKTIGEYTLTSTDVRDYLED